MPRFTGHYLTIVRVRLDLPFRPLTRVTGTSSYG